MFLLEVQDFNSQAIEATLDDTLFYIVLDWNDSGQYWTMAIRNSAYRTLIDGISVTPSKGLTYQFRYDYMPKGEIMAQLASGAYGNGPIPRNGFSSGKYELIYLTEGDLISANILAEYGKTNPDAF